MSRIFAKMIFVKLQHTLLLAAVFAGTSVAAQTTKKSPSHQQGSQPQTVAPASKAALAPPQVFTYVEQMPAPGYDYQQYLGSHIHYPDSALVHDIEGRVVVKFIVNEDGHISDCTIEKSVNSYIDAEALRVVRSFPRWQPGRQNGKPVRVYFTLPIVFKLTD